MKPLQLDPIASLDLDAPEPGAGQPLQIAVELIDEDPGQPRFEFDAEALEELAGSVRQRGVLQAVSVRTHPERAGRWLLNFGARRLRASRMADRPTIPAYVDETVDTYDQVLENEQRESLKPLELALFIQRRLAVGESQADIARRMSKTRQYVSLATALIDAPDWLLNEYRQGRCRGMLELAELRRLYAEAPEFVAEWVAARDGMSRDRVRELRELVGQRKAGVALDETPVTHDSGRATAEAPASPIPPAPASLEVPRQVPQPSAKTAADRAVPRATPASTRAARRLLASLDGITVAVVVDLAPAEPGRVFVDRVDGDAGRDAVEACRLSLIGFSEALLVAVGRGRRSPPPGSRS